MSDFERQLTEEIASCYGDPLKFAKFAWPWGEKGSPLEKYQLDNWQADYLKTLGEEIRARRFDGHTAVDPIRIAVASGHG